MSSHDKDTDFRQHEDERAQALGFRDRQHAQDSERRAIDRELREQGGVVHAFLELHDSLKDVQLWIETIAYEFDRERRGDGSVNRFDFMAG